MSIELIPVTIENWYDCTRLKVKQEQTGVFPAPVVYWIAESKFVHDYELRVICFEALPVGFLVYCRTPDADGNHWIPALMIDEKHQGNGFAKKAMRALIEHMRHLGCQRLMIGHRPDNHTAGHLYESLGFHRVSDEIIEGEVIRLLELN
ncbi:GNAT family N-acetyltransferase [Paenibacillus sp. DMB5]|uniref:GNAT family N-acetyltransferase n=1 Tax=Paenibacillus sp. DMB5 TaxID=1780103 RepID=UPI0009E80A27|nr:GNAT family N-acetyltransferase [Paenibacillus sp. DMB5]